MTQLEALLYSHLPLIDAPYTAVVLCADVYKRQHLSYKDFVDSIDDKMQSTAQDEVDTDEIEKRVEEMLNRYKWQEV